MSKLTKGFIKNNSTKITKPFMYNPTEIQYRRGATYSEISAPGSPYPKIAFIKGEVTSIPLKLFLSDREKSGTINAFLKFMDGFFPEENSNALFKKPTTMTVSLGQMIKVCIPISMDVRILDYSSIGVPTRAEISIELKVVA